MKISIEHLLDKKRPGYLLPGNPLSGMEFMEACRRGLRWHDGRSLKLVATSLDPLSGKILRPLAPEPLRKALEEAQARYGEAEALTTQAFKHWREAMNGTV